MPDNQSAQNNSEDSQNKSKNAPRSADYVRGRKQRIISYPVIFTIFALLFAAIALPILIQVVGALIIALSLGAMSGTGSAPQGLNEQPRLLYGAIDRSGKVAVPVSYLALGDFHSGLARTTGTPWHHGDEQFNRRYGYLTKTNQTLVGEKYKEAADFSEGLAAVRGDKADTWGYIDTKNNLVIAQQYSKAAPFKDGFAAVEANLQCLLIDKSGHVCKTHVSEDELVDQGVSRAPGVESYACNEGAYNDRVFRDGLATARSHDKWGFVDKKSWKIKAQYDDVQPFREGLAPIKMNGKWGFIDLSGKLKIKPQFQNVGRFSEGLAKFQENFKWGFIDKTGKIVIPPTFSGTGDFAQGLAGVENDQCRWGYIDLTGRLVVPMQYDEVRSYSEERAVVALNVPLLEKQKENAK